MMILAYLPPLSWLIAFGVPFLLTLPIVAAAWWLDEIAPPYSRSGDRHDH